MNRLDLSERLQAWLPLLPLLVLLGGTYWLNQQVLPLPLKPDDSKRHDPDYMVNNFSAISLSEQGQPRFILAAQQMLHYPDDDSTHLEEPRLTSPYANRPPVHFSARHGEVSRNGDEIFLRDGVKIVRDGSATQNELVLTTSYLHVVPDSELADTDRYVTLESGNNVLRALGMQLDSKAREFRLLDQVRGQYDAAQR